MLRAIAFFALLSMTPGCGGDEGGKPSGDAGPSGTPNAIDACALVSQSDANTLFGQTAVKQSGVTTPDPALIGDCQWGYDAPDNSSQLLQIQVWAKATYYSAPTGSQPYAIGDGGYVSVGGLAGVDIGWVQAGKTIMLSYSTIGPSVPEASTKAEEVKTLAKKVEAAL